jgi:hypothetical protein
MYSVENVRHQLRLALSHAYYYSVPFASTSHLEGVRFTGRFWLEIAIYSNSFPRDSTGDYA